MKILVVEPDAGVRLLLRYSLEAFEHEALVADGVSAAGAHVRDHEPDALVLASTLVKRSGSEAKRVIDLLSGGRSLPVLFLVDPEDELATADVATLEKPFTAEAFLARLEQTLAEQPETSGWETGVVTGNQLLEVLQDLETRNLSGHVRLMGDRRHGLIDIVDGLVAGAQFGLLDDTDAMLAMMQMPAAFFSFEAADMSEVAVAERSEEDSLDLAELTLQMARLEGELARRNRHLPRADQPLVTVSEVPPDGTVDAPLIQIYDRIHHLPGITIEDLLAQQVASPLRVRLAVAQLSHFGSISTIAS